MATGDVRTGDPVTIVRGEEELYRRVGHLFLTATDIACVANDLALWVAAGREVDLEAAALRRAGSARIRKIYRSGLLLDAVSAQELTRRRDRHGAQIRITSDELSETVIVDRRVAILAGESSGGPRSYSVITQPETVQGVVSLFDTVWRSATDLDVYDAQVAEIRRLAPAVLDLLGQGAKDEAAARQLGLSVRTYRRRVGELMAALGAESRFQAGVRARELGLV
ncbi:MULTISPECIES: DNA-binding response regulator [Prauserella salsuginis group]|uniref:DNA-binding response regulator n=1 Tax=Prauserella salsuginis TaxID=387889 RepID=A0ABW6FW21_9PSEU|nr:MULTISPECIES: DNA-binding response regulator [Prauserella salsuginis group]MCR3720183.1 hypothetical protein [Prauserella flava]MCR3734108.1 hypothetical protein [Prauserella salsuginis]